MQPRNDCRLWKVQKEGQKPSYLCGSLHYGFLPMDTYNLLVEMDTLNTLWLEDDVSGLKQESGDILSSEIDIVESLRHLRGDQVEVKGLDDFTVNDLDTIIRILKAIQQPVAQALDAYNKRNIKALHDAAKSKLSDEDYEFILERRNKAWIKKAFQNGGELVVVGAIHLFGENGLLNLLHNKGYIITPLEDNPSLDILFNNSQFDFEKEPASEEKIYSGGIAFTFEDLKKSILSALTKAELGITKDHLFSYLKEPISLITTFFGINKITRHINIDKSRQSFIDKYKNLFAETADFEKLHVVLESFTKDLYKLETGKNYLKEHKGEAAIQYPLDVNETLISRDPARAFFVPIIEIYSMYARALAYHKDELAVQNNTKPSVYNKKNIWTGVSHYIENPLLNRENSANPKNKK